MKMLARLKWRVGLLGAILLAGVLGAAPTLAAVTTGIEEGGALQQALGLGTGDVRIIIANLIRIFLGLLGVIAVSLIVYGGFLWMTSAGNEERVHKAKMVLVNAIIGLVIIMMSYIIVAFVLGRLLEAIGFSSTTVTGGDGSSGGITTTANVFTIDSVSPQGTQTIKNLTVRMTFNRDVDDSAIKDDITITPEGSTTPVEVNAEVEGDRVRFQSATLCEGYDDEYCFESNTLYTITIGSTLRSTDGLLISCGGLYDACTYTFTTGDLVDTTAPTVEVTYPEYDDSVSVDALVPLQAYVEDDAGVSEVAFYVDGTLIDTVQPDGDTPLTYTAEIDWDTSMLTELERYSLTAVASDVNDHTTESDEVRVIARAAHCFNGSTDEDETGEDCGGADCGACGGDSCTDDESCQSGVCSEDGVCVDEPEITGVSPGSGSVGSFVSISGNNFGSTRGAVYFDDIKVEFADCEDSWSDDQVIVLVPTDAVVDEKYTITLTTGDGYSDTTQDDNGSLIDDFVVDTTDRPGICSVTPSGGEVGSIAVLRGANFGDSQGDSTIYFGETEANAYTSWSDDDARVTVPTLIANDYEVTLWVDGVSSNEVDFEVIDSDAGEAPVISAIDPDTGPIGQYVTITGSGFGSSPDLVYFTDNDPTSDTYEVTTVGDVDFPAVCEDGYWTRTQIIVKVPEGVDAVDYLITVRNGTDTSNAADFVVTTGEAGPGVCSLSPDSGPVGLTDVTLSGEGFGTSQGDGGVTFYSDVSATITSWDDEEVVVTVPDGALTGPVTLTDTDSQDSNATNFEIGNCNETNFCDANTEQCCASGSCVSINGTCPETEEISAEYVWTFSTGPIPVVPTIQVDCSEDLISPTPWDGRSGGDTVCVNAGISATFDVNMDTTTLSDAGNISLAKCEDAACATTTAVTLGSVSTTATSFTVYPDVSLDASSLYQVTLSSAITSSLDIAIPVTTWTFETSADSDDCDYAGVNVTPSTETIEELGGHATYNSRVLAQDVCIILNDEDVKWTWSLDPASGSFAAFDDTYDADCSGEPSDCQVVEGVAEGNSVITAEENTQGLDDDADVLVNFTNPRAVDYWPGCATGGTACINAAIGAQFNTEMDKTTVESAGNIHLYACSDESCTTHTDDIGITVERSDADETIVNIYLNDSDYTNDALLGATYYEVVFSADILSQSGVDLREYYDGDFSWTFLTRDSTEVCAVDHVVLEPTSATADYVGATSVFDSVPYSDADDCSTAGQRLTATGYDWTWAVANASIASLWSSGDVEVVDGEIPAGCTASCLPEGTDSYVAICGEDGDGDGDLLDVGEDCDDGDGISGDGCSSTCQSEGTSACASETDSNCCGNNTLDTGEECDDTNTANGDGCSSSCLNEGASAGVATCGGESTSGIVTHSDLLNSSGWAGGEDCDDGGTENGDGCSSTCLNEGSTSTLDIVGICGDGRVDGPAEQCDDGDVDNGDGCSENCLYEGSDECSNPVTDLLCCSNGISEASAYESCDDGNRVSGDGCSATCLLEGSSSLYAEPSWCGDGVSGIGEVRQDGVYTYASACEVSTSDLDGITEPEQVTVIAVTAPAEVENGVATTVVSAQAADETGQASLSLTCSCESDSQCTTSAATVSLGCGTGGCCFERPTITAYTPVPTDGDACRNTLISFDFDSAMALATFTDNVAVDLQLEGTETCPYPSDGTSAMFGAPTGLFARAWSAIRGVFGGFVGSAEAVEATCAIPITFTSTPITGGERVSVIYTQLLEEDHDYFVTIAGDPSQDGSGVRTTTGVGMATDYTFTVSVGDDICSFDTVEVEDVDEDSPGLFTTVAETHAFTATAMTVASGTSEAIIPIAGIYDWDWAQTWWSTDTTVLSVPLTGTDTGSESANTVTAEGENGSASIYASATIIDDTLFDPTTEGDVVYGSSEITANLCENPWPALGSSSTWSPFEDASTASADPDGDGVDEVDVQDGWMHFSTYYCRDAGDPGSTGDYPAADVVAVAEPPSSVIKEYLFELDGGDAIGIRVARNSDLLSISDWYDEQEFTGSPAETTVDGYQALEDGRTVYVSAANVSGDSSGTIYPNIYVLSYNEDASSETIAVFDQMLENWQFNSNLTNDEICYESSNEPTLDEEGEVVTCTSDLDCTSGDCRADKGKLRRDMQRLTDLKQIAADLDDYGSDNGRCSATTSTSCTSDDDCPGVETCEALYPIIDAGSFLRSMSSSAWDSWQNVFGAELGVTVPTDPVNTYEGCGVAGGSYADYNADTCWYEAAAQYVCPEGSFVYNYKNIGGTSYNLWGDLEYTYVTGTTEWFGEVDSDVSDDLSILAGRAFLGTGDGFQEDATCDGSVMGTSVACGDGVIGSSERCEIGDTSTTSCEALTCISSDPDYDGAACIIDCDDATICSGGDADENGVCDSGLASGQACGTGDVDCTDTTICSTSPYFEITDGTQASLCDTATCNTYTAAPDAECVPYRCGNGVIDLDAGETCDDGSHNGDYGYCGTNCAWDSSAFYCGDGTLAGGETCDNGASNGVYMVTAVASCNTTCDGPGDYCGDGEVTNSEVCDGSESWDGEFCVGGTDDGETCEADSDCDSGICGVEYSCAVDTAVSCSGLDDVSLCALSTDVSCEGASDTTSCGSWGTCNEDTVGYSGFYCAEPIDSTSTTSCTGPDDTTSCPASSYCVQYEDECANTSCLNLVCRSSNPIYDNVPLTIDCNNTTTCGLGDGDGDGYCNGTSTAGAGWQCDGGGDLAYSSTTCDDGTSISGTTSGEGLYQCVEAPASTSGCSGLGDTATCASPLLCADFDIPATGTCELTADISCGGASDTTTCQAYNSDLECEEDSCGSWGSCVVDSATVDGYYCALPIDPADPYGTSCTGLDDTTSCMPGTYCVEYASGTYACMIDSLVDCTSANAFVTDWCAPVGPTAVPCARFFAGVTYTCELDADISCDGASDATTCEAYSSSLSCESNASSAYASCGTGTVCEDYEDAGVACTDDTNCDSGSCTGGYCDSAADVGNVCEDAGDCDSDTCSDFEYDLTRSRTCDSACLVAGSWSDCVRSDESCGNGVVDGSEECDDGNESNNDSCTNLCTENFCGDGYLYTGHETCDRGDENGETCTAEYGSTCRYCSYDCTYLTASSAYCGDAVADEPEEFCDADDLTQFRCYDGRTGDLGDLCSIEGSASGCDSGYTCRNVGLCDGGEYDGEYCTSQDTDSIIADWDYDSGETGPWGQDYGFCDGGTCVLPSCADDCSSTCPYSYGEETVEVTSEEAGATARSSISLYSSDTSESPNSATLTIPACLLADSLVADILSSDDYSYPDVYVMFVLDTSTAMVDDLDVLEDVVTEAASTMFDQYQGASATMNIGFATLGGYHGNDYGDDGYSSTDLYNFVDDFGHEISDDESVLVPAMSSALGSIFSDPGTPVYKSLEDAANALPEASGADRYIILFSAGDIGNYDLADLYDLQSDYDTDGDGSLEQNEYLALIAATANDIKDDGVQIFTVALTSDDEDLGYLAHISSDTCGESEPLTDDECSLGLGESCDVDADCYVGTCSSGSSETYCSDDADCNPETSRYCVDESISDPSGGTCEDDGDCFGLCNGGSIYANCDEYESGGNNSCDILDLGGGSCDGVTLGMADNPMTTETDESTEDTPGNCSISGASCTSDLDCGLPSTSTGTCSESGACLEASYTYSCEAFSTAQTCEEVEDAFADEDDCSGSYSYSTSDPDELEDLFGSIVDVIGGATVTVVDEEGNSATSSVEIGDAASLPLPDGFLCDSTSSQELYFEVTFAGEGSINFDNFTLDFCAP